MAALQTRSRRVAPTGYDPVDLTYRVAGEGSPVILLHGIGLDAGMVSWREVVPALAEQYRVYAPDLPGHGDSDKPRVNYTTEYFRSVVSAFIEEHDLDDASIVGISMGGGVALSHALNGGDPERLVLVNSYGMGSDAYWRPSLTTLLNIPGFGTALWSSIARTRAGVRSAVEAMTAGVGADPALVSDVYETASQPGAVRAMRRWQRNEFGATGFRTDGRDQLEDLSVPTLLVHGAQDPLVPPRWSRSAAERLPDGELCLLESSGHWVPRERPDAFLDAVRPFLAD